ncbi:MAG: dihydropyrimidinase [Chloroflexi bacterium]|nr:dihydropyrimidinase [Chloroflexota bacterium]
MFDLIIYNGSVVFSHGTLRVDIGVKDGKIAALEQGLDTAAATQTLDATGLLIFPGFIDSHTHMGIPIKDTWSADDFESGSRAAAWGGVTTILDFTVQARGQSYRQALDERRGRAQGKSHIDYGIHVNVTDNNPAWQHEIGELISEGFTHFKAFTTYREAGMMIEPDDMRRVLGEIGRHGGFLMLHAEDNELIAQATAPNLAAGNLTPIYHARSRPATAEAKAIRDAAAIARDLDAQLYIVHLSSQAGLEAGLEARAKGTKIYLETCPQYLLMTEQMFARPNGHWVITTPPMRTAADAQALWQALADGHIDTVATDHCPFTIAQKESGGRDFSRTPNGIPGVATLFPLLYTYGVAEGQITLKRLLELLAENPARIFGLDDRKGKIAIGMDADLVLWDEREETTIQAQEIPGAADWNPYEGVPVAGKVVSTLSRGRVLIANGQFVGMKCGESV